MWVWEGGRAGGWVGRCMWEGGRVGRCVGAYGATGTLTACMQMRRNEGAALGGSAQPAGLWVRWEWEKGSYRYKRVLHVVEDAAKA